MGAKLDERRFSAKEAREIADGSEIVLARIYKVIRDSAEEGTVKLEWAAADLSEACKATIVGDLRASGYSVEATDCSFVISW